MNMLNKTTRTTTTITRLNTIVAIVAALAIITVYQSGLIVNADALTRYFNCTTRIANKNGTLTLANIENCYDNVFKGAKEAEKDALTK